MIRCVGRREMQDLDRRTIEEAGLSSATLMERAALFAVQTILPHLKKQHRIVVVCGSGNNGGDGIAVARLLFLMGYDASYYLTGDEGRASEGAKGQLHIARYYRVPVAERSAIQTADVLVDALFGVGLTREITDHYRDLIEEMNASAAFKVAVDLPSGIQSDTGQVLGIAFRADLTACFAYRKIGLCLYPGRDYAGDVHTGDIGIYGASSAVLVPERADLLQLPPRPPFGNKGSFGKVLLLAGSRRMCGAAYLAAHAALLMGCGMVQILTAEENRIPLQTLLPEALIASSWEEEDLLRLLDWCDVLLLGPGLGKESREKEALSFLLSEGKKRSRPTVLDADGLNLLAATPDWRVHLGSHLILTPHMGEMSRLTSVPIWELKEDPLLAAQTYARDRGVTCVLKDATTVTAGPDGDTYLNLSGNDGMATAGSGDVLCGILSGLLCRYVKGKELPSTLPKEITQNSPSASAPSFTAIAALGVCFHGCCGDLAAEERGKNSLTARDLLGAIPKLFHTIRTNYHES